MRYALTTRIHLGVRLACTYIRVEKARRHSWFICAAYVKHGNGINYRRAAADYKNKNQSRPVLQNWRRKKRPKQKVNPAESSSSLCGGWKRAASCGIVFAAVVVSIPTARKFCVHAQQRSGIKHYETERKKKRKKIVFNTCFAARLGIPIRRTEPRRPVYVD